MAQEQASLWGQGFAVALTVREEKVRLFGVVVIDDLPIFFQKYIHNNIYIL